MNRHPFHTVHAHSAHAQRGRRLALAAATCGLLTLAACGSTHNSSGSNSGNNGGNQVSTTVTVAATSAAGQTTVPAGAAGATTTVAGSSTQYVDPALQQQINDAKALISPNGQDLNDAAASAANGG